MKTNVGCEGEDRAGRKPAASTKGISRPIAMPQRSFFANAREPSLRRPMMLAARGFCFLRTGQSSGGAKSKSLCEASFDAVTGSYDRQVQAAPRR